MSRIAIPALRAVLVSLSLFGPVAAVAQGPLRGSIIEDRAARKLMEAGDARYEADEAGKAVEIWGTTSWNATERTTRPAYSSRKSLLRTTATKSSGRKRR